MFLVMFYCNDLVQTFSALHYSILFDSTVNERVHVLYSSGQITLKIKEGKTTRNERVFNAQYKIKLQNSSEQQQKNENGVKCEERNFRQKKLIGAIDE